MKLDKQIIILFLAFVISVINCRNLKNLNSVEKGTCSISTISIPTGTNFPVMIYNAKVGDQNLRLTVLDNEQTSKYKVEGSLFYSDRKSGESWFVDKDLNEGNHEAMRDAFSLCRTLNTENRINKDYEHNTEYDNIRTSALPGNVSLRVVKDKAVDDLNSRTTSFLQLKENIDNEISDSEIEEELDNLEKDELYDPIAEQYKSLNNDAYEQNKDEDLSDDSSNENQNNSII